MGEEVGMVWAVPDGWYLYALFWAWEDTCLESSWRAVMLFTSEFTLRGSQEDLMLLERYWAECWDLKDLLPKNGSDAATYSSHFCHPYSQVQTPLGGLGSSPVYTFRAQDLTPLKQEKHLCLEHVWTEHLLFAGMTVVVKPLLFNSHNSPESFHHHHEFWDNELGVK